MKLEKIVSLANKNTEIRFLAMVRSLRATGCDLPVWVIPYDDKKFDLPDNCIWWEIEEIITWLNEKNAHQMMRKYQCLVTTNYQYVDTDVVFLKNPENVLLDLSGFVTSCGHWHHSDGTFNSESIGYLRNTSSTWYKSVFNAGQYACDVKLFDIDSLKKIVEDPQYASICLSRSNTNDQIALNLLITLSKVSVTNLTLPPYNMESSWAGDYEMKNYSEYWRSEQIKPYLIHWAGCKMDTGRPIDKDLFLSYLSASEKLQWDVQLAGKIRRDRKFYPRLIRNLRIIKHALSSIEFI